MVKATKKSTAIETPSKNDMLYRSKLKVKVNKNNSNNSNNINGNNEEFNTPPTTGTITSSAPPSSSSAATKSTTRITTLENQEEQHNQHHQQQQQSPPLKKLSLRGNQLCGSILIGNYNYLTQLEVCENEMEVLDLSSLAQLETLKCSRNKLMELMLNGSSLHTLLADYNCLHTITINPVPLKLTHIDLSHNYFNELPSWIGACVLLHQLLAQNNQLADANNFLRETTYRINALRVLNLSYNCLQSLIDKLPEACASLKELHLQSNELQRLPENFFAVTHINLRLLNLSCNKLITLPRYEQNNGCALEDLSLSGNQLNERIFDALIYAHNLRTLHAAYNRIGELPEASVRHWPELEVLVLAGNMLQQLPDSIAALHKLQVLRVHSNLLLATPTLAKLSQLKVLDLAHNHLDRVNLLSLVPKNLKYLDLSANVQLQVDEQQLKVCQTQSQRHWSLIDVSGKNRDTLPTTIWRGNDQTSNQKANNQQKPPWLLGFAESPGKCRKLLVSQLRQPGYRPDEGLFGMFEYSKLSCGAGNRNGGAANTLATLVPRILQREKTLSKESMNDYLKYTLLTVQKQLPQCEDDDNCLGAAICHLAKEMTRSKVYVRPLKTKRYVLRVASMGQIGAYLVRKTTNLCLTQQHWLATGGNVTANLQQRQGVSARISTTDPDIVEVTLTNDDEYLVLSNAKVWAVLDIERVAREIRKAENALLAAKRVQDIAQSFGAQENLSVIVVRFRNIGTDVEHLIKELKQSVRKKSNPPVTTMALMTPSVCKRTCCDRSNACRHRAESIVIPARREAYRSERSSPSGQSDQLHKDGGDEFVLAHARVLEEEQEMEMLDETESVLSEEQFKCWEYMLEQNTQLLFDKELNTISKSFTKNRNVDRKVITSNGDRFDFKSNLMKSVTNKFMSSSSPQLLYPETKKPLAPINAFQHQNQNQQQQQLSFLSKHFGSSRSFQQSTGYNLIDSKSRDSLAIGSHSKLGGGPNAAYFGSLQRLMPYNLEYDFAVTQERNILDEEDIDIDIDDDEYSEHESRMRKYWGVATTEL